MTHATAITSALRPSRTARRGRVAGPCCAAVLWAATLTARAQLPPEGPAEELPQVAPPSPQRFALEVKFAPYLPSIDSFSAIGNAPDLHPFSTQFGNGAPVQRQVLGQVEFDWQFWKTRLGPVGAGLSAGYYHIGAPQQAYLTTDPNNTMLAATGPYYVCTLSGGVYQLPAAVAHVNPAPSCLSGDQQSLNLVPLTLLGVFRFDYLDRKWGVPIIPYAKAGVGYYIWWLGAGGQFVAHREVYYNPTGGADKKGAYYPITDSSQQVALQGASWGLVLQPGLAIDLGVIDRQAAKVLDQETGINRFSLFFELQYGWVNGFGAVNKLNLSDVTYNVGLGFEF